MKRKFATIMSCSVLLASQVASSNSTGAQESFRVKRPSASEDATDASVNRYAGTSGTLYSGTSVTQFTGTSATQFTGTTRSQFTGIPGTRSEVYVDAEPKAPMQDIATMALESPSIAAFQKAVYAWKAENNPNMHAQTGTIDSAHHGLKSHLGGAFLLMASAAGGVANSYVPIATVSADRRFNVPQINVGAGHCPARVDPAFQIPVKWWDALSEEQSDPVMGPQWKFWLEAVEEVFAARARELLSTPGAASLHVIVNPNGTIFNMSPYTGSERSHPNLPISEPTLMHLRDMVGTMGVFPPFPSGTKVRGYHLILNGSAGVL